MPKGNLMNRTGDVNADGDYVSQIQDRKKRIGITLGTLSMGRVGIIPVSVANMQKALTIAIRYSAARRQFGPKEGDVELPVIEYQMQQWRLFPYLAATYVLDVFSQSLLRDFLNFQVAVLFGTSSPELSELGQEIHALACAAKPLSGWLCRDAIQECREACGGHGFLKASCFGELRDDHDANNTYEGDNNVLQMQTSNFLMRIFREAYKDGEMPFVVQSKHIARNPWSQKNKKAKLTSQLGSINLFKDLDQIMGDSFVAEENGDQIDFDVLMKAYRHLVCYLMTRAHSKYSLVKSSKGDDFAAKNESQV